MIIVDLILGLWYLLRIVFNNTVRINGDRTIDRKPVAMNLY